VLVFLGALYSSYSIWPVFPPAPADAVFPSFARDAPLYALDSLDGMLRTTVVISAPVIIVMFLATLGLGLVNRTAPQLNVFFLSMPVKSALGIFMLIIYLQYLLRLMIYDSDDAILVPVQKFFH
jgi:type III secretion protein T